METRPAELDEQLLMEFAKSERVEAALQITYDFAKLMSYYKCAIMEIETKFNVLNEEFSLRFDREPISSIKTRLKDPTGILNKMRRKNLPLSMESVEEHINDVAGIRVICSFVDDVYMLAKALEKQDDIEILTVKDYIKSPKENGYRSLHLIVSVPIFLQQEKRIMKAEIQLRTIAMDFWASLEHQLRYKKDIDFTEEMSADIKQCAEMSAELDAKMNEIMQKVDIEHDEKDIVKYLSKELLG